MTETENRKGTPAVLESSVLKNEIEYAYAGATRSVRIVLNIWYNRSPGAGVDAHNNFYSDFALLVLLTRPLPNMEKSTDLVKRCMDWLKSDERRETDAEITSRIVSGLLLYEEYTLQLSKQGVISMPKI